MSDTVKLKIDGDASGLLAAVKSAMNQIQKEADKIKLAPTPKAAGATSAGAPVAPQAGSLAFQQALTATRAQESKSRAEQQALQIANRELDNKKRKLDDIRRQEAESAKTDKDKNFYAAERNRLEKEYQTLLGTKKRLQETNQKTLGKQTSPGQEKLPSSGTDMARQALGQFSFTGVVGGITAAVLQGITQIAGSPSRTIVAGGSAVSRTVGREVSSLYNGTLPNELAFTQEKSEAKEMANKQEAAERAKDTTKTTAGGALMVGAGATALSAGWTGVGLLAAGASALAGIGTLLSSQRMRAKTTSALTENIFPEYSKQQKQEYESLLAQDNAENFTKNYEAKKQLNPLKVLAVDEYNQNAQRDLDFQRQMGLGTQGFRGKFKNEMFDSGFTAEQGMGMASGIMGAGGSTRSAVGNAGLGLQAQRNLDITNAGSIIGKLSGSMGGAETTKEAFVKILAEGTKVGLDGSDFREENRKFVESAAQMISQSGTTTGGGVDQLLSEFGKFFGDKTSTGLEAGKGAYELYRQTSMATTGPRATMRAAGMLSDPIIGQLPRDSREALFNMPIDQLTPDNPAIMAMAKQANTTPDQLISAQNKITAKSANLFKGSDVASKNLENVKKRYGVKSAIGFQGPLSQSAYDEMQTALGESNIAQVKEHPELGQNQRMTSAYSDALSSGDAQKANKALEDAKKSQLEVKTTGRPEDETNKIRAEMSKQVNQIFMDMKDSIVPAAGAAEKFVKQIKDLNAAMMALPEGERAGFANKNILPIYGHVPTTAPSAGAPASGGGSGS